MNFEICTDSVDGAIAAHQFGAKRIELCAALSVGGLTPNYGLIKECTTKSQVEVHVMIRHKEGDFCYDDKDMELMKIDIEKSKEAGAHGVVFGILTNDHLISPLNKELLKYAKNLELEVTFHRAFDFVKDYHQAMQTLIAFKFDRLLTSGLHTTAEQGLAIITELQKVYGSQIQIMAGSGVNAKNAKKIALSGIDNLHFTARKPSHKPIGLSMGEFMVVDEDKIKDIVSLF